MGTPPRFPPTASVPHQSRRSACAGRTDRTVIVHLAIKLYFTGRVAANGGMPRPKTPPRVLFRPHSPRQSAVVPLVIHPLPLAEQVLISSVKNRLTSCEDPALHPPLGIRAC